MRVFVYEYTCAASSGSALPPSLRTEGQAMLEAVLADFARIKGVQTCTLLTDDFAQTLAHECQRTGRDERTAFCALARAADWSLVIAPEFDELLETRCRWVAEAGGKSLNSSLEAIRLAGDKLELARHFREYGIPTPATSLRVTADFFPAVVKPRFGAGSQATFLVRAAAELGTVMKMAAGDGIAGELIVQPFVPGQPASVALLLGQGGRISLWPAAQHLSTDGRFRYLGGTVPLPERYWQRARSLAERAVASVPGLRGYVGVDLILGEPDDGSADVVIEINPRLTTSYLGLRQLTESNLAAQMLALVIEKHSGECVPPIRRGNRIIRYHLDGQWAWA